jgi:amidase
MRIGSALFEDHISGHDGASVRRLRAAGFVPVGRTAMPEFGILPTTEPRLGGPTRNPWNTALTPGGSSGGSAAAVAAGVVVVKSSIYTFGVASYLPQTSRSGKKA